MTLWIPWGMCTERLNYCNRHITVVTVGLPELHNTHNKKLWRGNHWVTSEDTKIDEHGKKFRPNLRSVYTTFKKIFAENSITRCY